MVSLAAVEALASEAFPGAALMVVSLPDARKGERLVLMTTDATLKRDALLRHARARGAAELMVPADIVVVDSLPLLGTGKPDYVAATALAREKVAAPPQESPERSRRLIFPIFARFQVRIRPSIADDGTKPGLPRFEPLGGKPKGRKAVRSTFSLIRRRARLRE